MLCILISNSFLRRVIGQFSWNPKILWRRCTIRKLLAVSVVCLVLACGFGMAQAAEVKIVLATGGTAGTYYPFGGAMAKIWNSKIPGMNVTAQTTGASGENVRLVNKKEAELALVQSDTLDFAFSAKEAFKEKLTNMMAVAVLSPNHPGVVRRPTARPRILQDSRHEGGSRAPGQRHGGQFPSACVRRLRHLQRMTSRRSFCPFRRVRKHSRTSTSMRSS